MATTTEPWLTNADKLADSSLTSSALKIVFRNSARLEPADQDAGATVPQFACRVCLRIMTPEGTCTKARETVLRIVDFELPKLSALALSGF